MDRLNYISWIKLDGRIEVISNPLSRYVYFNIAPKRFRPKRLLKRDNIYGYYLWVYANKHYKLLFSSC